MKNAFWEIYYSDGTSISSENTTPSNIEHHEDVQVIIQKENEHKWVTLSGTDFYVWDDRGEGAKWWRVNDRFGVDYYLRKPGCKCVLFGTWIETKDFRKIFNKARKKLGDKHIFTPQERKP